MFDYYDWEDILPIVGLILFVLFIFVGLPFLLLNTSDVSSSDNISNLEQVTYLEYPNSVLAVVYIESYEVGNSCYGFIDKDDYEKFKNGEQLSTLTVRHIYKEGEESTFNIDKIVCIDIGRNEDYEMEYLNVNAILK